jgi:zinc transport system substrate-binding protein
MKGRINSKKQSAHGSGRTMRCMIACAMLLSMLTLTILTACTGEEPTDTAGKLLVGVTIVPQKAFVRAVCGDLADVIELVPPGFSPESYDPTPVQMSRLSKAAVFFTLDLPAEQNMDFTMLADTTIIDLADPISEAYPDRYFSDGEDHQEDADDYSADAAEDDEDGDGHDHTGRDPHVWISPRRAAVMVQTIADEMGKVDPANAATYAANAEATIAQLTALDEELTGLFDGIPTKTIIVFHPAFGYFADDYGIEMLALEDNGREATAVHLTEMIDIAREKGIRTIFIQKESATRQADSFAQEIGGRTVELDPLSEDYIVNIRHMASEIAEALHEQG